MAHGKTSFNGQTFEASVKINDGRWLAQVSELNTKNDPIRFGPEEAESESEGKKLCEAFLFELFQQRLWR